MAELHNGDSNTQDLTNTGLAFAAEDKKDMALLDALSKQVAKRRMSNFTGPCRHRIQLYSLMQLLMQ